jgi:ubiquitin C-terminal hydrolase
MLTACIGICSDTCLVAHHAHVAVALLLLSHAQITCEGVDYTSSTFDPFLDLSLEITKAHSLTRALQHFTAAEVLDGDNKYRCPKNNKLVRSVVVETMLAWWLCSWLCSS